MAEVKFDYTARDKTGQAFASVKNKLEDLDKRAKGVAASFAKTGALLGSGLLVGAIATLTGNAVRAADEMNDMAQRVGISVEALSAFSYVAKMSGTDVEVFAKGLQYLNKNLSLADSGSKGAAGAFKQLGLNVGELKTLKPEEQFIRIAEKIGNLDSAADRTRATMEIFGKAGYELVPIMNAGGEAIADLVEEAKELGLVMSQEEADKIGRFNDAWDTMTMKLQALARNGFLFLYDAVVATKDALNELFGDAESMSTGGLEKKIERLKKEVEAASQTSEDKVLAGKIGNIPIDKTGISTRNAEIDRLTKELEKRKAAEDAINKMRGQGSGGSDGRLIDQSAGSKKERDRVEEFIKNTNREISAMENKILTHGKSEGVIARVNKQQELQNLLQDESITLTDEQREKIEMLLGVYEQKADEVGTLNKDMEKGFDDLSIAIGTAFEDAVIEGENFRDVMLALVKDIQRIILRVMVTEPLQDWLRGVLKGGGKSGGGGLVDLLGSLWGGAHANGGTIPSGKIGLVGERGPELAFAGSSPLHIQPMDGGSGQGGGTTVHVAFNIATGVAQTVQAEIRNMMPGIVNQVKSAVADAAQRGGRFPNALRG